jgi:hypothetical protein
MECVYENESFVFGPPSTYPPPFFPLLCAHPNPWIPRPHRSESGQRLPRATQPIQDNINIRPEPVHRDQPQVPSKVPRVQPAQRQPVPEPSHGRLKVRRLEVGRERLRGHGRVHVRPYEWDRRAGDPPAFVRDLDCDVLLALDDDDLDRREGVLVLDAVPLDDGAEGVLQQLEADVGEVAGDVRERERGRADELDGRAFEHGVVFFADEAGVFDRFGEDVVDVSVCADYADIILMGLLGV